MLDLGHIVSVRSKTLFSPEQNVAATKLSKYQGMRDFSQTAEPSGKDAKVVPSEALRFVIQKHAASQLHFDLRLEYEGTFRSWAVPKPCPASCRLKRR
jgi:DNA ligase D-like protein (predicted 3'-phosphoesterase)